MAVRPANFATGDTIEIVTLGSPLDASVIDARVQTLQSMGFKSCWVNTSMLKTGFWRARIRNEPPI